MSPKKIGFTTKLSVSRTIIVVSDTVNIKGYNSNNTLKWAKDYEYVGSSPALEAGCGTYQNSIELIDKWEINENWPEISGRDIWDRRSDRPFPVIYVRGGSKATEKFIMRVSPGDVTTFVGGFSYWQDSGAFYKYESQGRLLFLQLYSL